MKKMLSLLLATVMLICLALPGRTEDTGLPFSDVADGAWYCAAVREVYDAGLMFGRTDTLFAPQGDVTRAELVTVLYRMSSADSTDTESPFSDVRVNDWFARYVSWGAASGLIDGYSDGTFRPNRSISRQEMAVLFHRYMDYIGISVSESDDAALFADSDTIASWSRPAISAMRHERLLLGDSGGNFKPESTATRAEIATLLSRVVRYIDEHMIKPDAFLDADGTEYTYTYCGEVSRGHFLEYIKSMADATDIFESAEIVTEAALTGTETISFGFMLDGETYIRTYKITFAEGDHESVLRTRIFVSPDGDDSAPGTVERPLRTPAAAVEIARTADRSAPVSVFFREGDYVLTESLRLGEEDSGADGSRSVTYAAYRGETVNFIGGVKIDSQKITHAEGGVAELVTDEAARAALLVADLSDLGLRLPACYEEESPALYIGDTALNVARWPNKDARNPYTQTMVKPIDNPDGSKTLGMFPTAARRSALWSESSRENAYIFGYLAYDWTNEYFKVTAIDSDARTVTIASNGGYFSSITRADRNYYFLNIPEELDAPGEMYMDREAGRVYFYPTADFDGENLIVSTNAEPLIELDGTHDVTFDGINVGYTSGYAVKASGVWNLTLQECNIAHGSSIAMVLDGTAITVSDCDIYDFVLGGIIITGGDRKTLTSGESVLENCRIHDINRTERPYRTAIQAASVGLLIDRCELYNCTHMALDIRTNDVKLTRSEIHHCLTNTGDLGAVAYGRNPSLLGTEITYNYFHDIGNELNLEMGQKMIYVDDGSIGAIIRGNIFERSVGDYNTAAINLHGAQFCDITGNMFVDLDVGFTNWGWTTDENGEHPEVQDRWFLNIYDRDGSGHGIPQLLLDVGFDSEIWREHYRGTIFENLYDYIDSERIEQYSLLSNDEMLALARECAPSGTNRLAGNVFVNVNEQYHMMWGADLTEYDNITESTDIFESYGDRKLGLTDDGLSRIRTKIPDFPDIPFCEMGVGGR